MRLLTCLSKLKTQNNTGTLPVNTENFVSFFEIFGDSVDIPQIVVALVITALYEATCCQVLYHKAGLPVAVSVVDDSVTAMLKAFLNL